MYKFLFHVVAYILTLFAGITIGSSIVLQLWSDSEEKKAVDGLNKPNTTS